MSKFKITIAEPCHENWDRMTQSEQGKFCGSCQKNVVDFTDFTNYEIGQFLGKPENVNTCGRFLKTQIAAGYNYFQPEKSPNFFKYAAGMAGILLLAQAFEGCTMGTPQHHWYGISVIDKTTKKPFLESVRISCYNTNGDTLTFERDISNQTWHIDSDEIKTKTLDFVVEILGKDGKSSWQKSIKMNREALKIGVIELSKNEMQEIQNDNMIMGMIALEK